MAKDPAFLFYHHDFIFGTAFMSLEDRGAYISILCYMADQGPMSIDQIKKVLGNYDASVLLKDKFLINENGLYYNKRLFIEVEKRKSFCESRRLSRTSNVRKTYVRHTENRNRNENRDVVRRTKGVFKKPTVAEIESYCRERGNDIDPQAFFDKNESIGWVVGKNKSPMKDWRATVRTWENYGKGNNLTVAQKKSISGMQRLEERWRNEEGNIQEGNGVAASGVSK